MTFKFVTAALPNWSWLRDYGPYRPADQYGVHSFPTTFILDSEGRVAARFFEFDEAGIRATLTRLGVYTRSQGGSIGATRPPR